MRQATVATVLGLVLAACGGAPAEPPAPREEAVAETTVVEAARATPPAPLPMEEVAFPGYAERTLRSGARLIVVRNDEQPVASVSLVVRAGDADGPPGLPGVADMTASLLDKGTTTRDAREIAEAVDFIGARLSVSASADWTVVGTTVLTEFLDEALDVVADVVMNPTFPENELETQRARDLSALRLQLSQPGALANRQFLAEVYGQHPYGASPTPASVSGLTRDHLVAFHRTHYVPGNALFVVAGAVEADEVARQIDEAFLGWSGEAPPGGERPAPPTRSARELVFVHKPGSVQAVIQVGHLMPSATGTDWATFDVANEVLGGSYTSWLNNILRAQKGWTYGAGSSAAERPDAGHFRARTQSRNEVADSALATMLELLDRIRSEPVPAEDLEQAQSYLTGSFPLSIETPSQIAGQVVSNTLLGRPPSYLEVYRSRLAAVDAADVQASARELLHPERAVVVVVGDATVLYERLAAYADRARLLDAEGSEISLDDVRADADADVAYVLDPAALEPGRYTYAVSYRGQPMGETEDAVVVDQEGERPVIRAMSEMGPPIAVFQEVIFDATSFEPIRFRMEGGRLDAMELIVEGGRVTGTGIGEQGQVREVDVEAPPGLLLPGMEGHALATMDLGIGSVYTLRTLNMAGAVQPMRVEVVGEETIEVPAGSFDVYVIRYSGQDVGTMYVRKERPHIMIRNALDEPPLVVELKEIR